jgi:cold shock CspA family protein
MSMSAGTIVKWFVNRNYGFIKDDSSGNDVFVHVSGFKFKVALQKGTRVWFKLGERQGKSVAFDVEPIIAKETANESR